MKKELNAIVGMLVILCFLLSACYKDEGNYDYRDINEIAISGLETDYSLIYKTDTLRIQPTLNFTQDSLSTDRYAYEWKAVPSVGTDGDAQIIGTDAQLNYPVSLLPGDYVLYLKIKDKQTDVVWSEHTTLAVRTAVSTGFLLIGEDATGTVQVEMVSMLPNDTIIVKDLLSNSGLPELTGAVGIMHTGGSFRPDHVKLWVMSKTGSYYVNTSTFESSPAYTFSNMVYSSFNLPNELWPIDIAPRVSRATGTAGSTSSRVVMCQNGYVFSCSLFSGDIYGNPTNRSSKTPNTLFHAAPYLIYSPGFWNSYMLYDEDNDRFLRATATAQTMTELVDNASDIFPWNQGETGRKLIYAENTKNTEGGSTYGNAFAIMKDGAGDLHIYKFYPYNATKRGYFRVKPIAVDINQAKLFAFSSLRTVLFYAVGSKLYGYDYNSGLEKSYLIQDFGQEISMINCDIQAGNSNELYVATYDPGTGGTIRKFIIGDNPNTLELEKDQTVEWTGLSKVKQMDWRNSNL